MSTSDDRWFRRLRNRRVDEFFMTLNPSQTVTDSEQSNVYRSGPGESTRRNQPDAAGGNPLFSDVASEAYQRERPSVEHDSVFCSSSSDSDYLQERMEQSDQYAVVKFPEEGDSVALVHTKWLHGDVCLWPQDSKNVSYLAKCGVSPSSNWQVVPCVPIGTFRTYDAARQKLKQAENGSDLGSEVDLGRGKRKKQRRALSSSPESVQRLPLPPSSMMKKAQKKDGRRIHKQSSHTSTYGANDADVCSDQGAAQCASETSESEGEVDFGDAKQESSGIRSLTTHSLMKKASQMRTSECNTQKRHSSLSVAPNSDDGIKQVIRLLQTVILRVEHLGSQLDVIKGKLCDHQLQPETDLLEKPFCDITEFELFDQELSENAAMKSKLMRELAALGGRNVSLSTRRILEALMTQEVAVHYSWLGQKGKKSSHR
ncbi:uncharacterized protein LOC119440276 [Dermacentor silvarum]|uniref:uncharacterized protein LOC119440276 n=1 Tax=Dermacentor silvarum TaxID=543639 RepID=UPI00210101DF|nr:uncharacterized protein LOC119440276 [Dermacentor silvarum]